MIDALYLGIIGMLLLLVSFFIEVFKLLHREHAVYLVLNLFGASIMTYYAYLINSWPFLLLNAAWALISLYGVIKISLKKNKE